MLIKISRDGKIETRDFSLISHRGGRGFGPENTLRSLEGALESGVEMIETDVRMSSDGVPVIHHSPFIGLRLLGHTPLEEIRERAPDIPTLEEFMHAADGRCAMNLEVKRCDPSILAEVLTAAESSISILVSTFDADFLAEFGASCTGTDLGLLSQYEPVHGRMVKEAERCGANVLLPVSFSINEDLIDAAHSAGLRLIAWTVNSTEQLEELVSYGVDGVITDSYLELERFLESGADNIRVGRAVVPESGGNPP
jgi:glycerophosphoryl diester phosphodiesterase